MQLKVRTKNYLAARLERTHGAQVCRGTLVEKHWSRHIYGLDRLCAYQLLYQLPMPVPNTETGYVSKSVEINKFKVKFEVTVFKIKLVLK